MVRKLCVPVVVSCLILAPHSADSAGLLKEVFSILSPGSAILTSEYSYFSDDLDVIGYLDSLGGTSRPEMYSHSALSIAYKF